MEWHGGACNSGARGMSTLGFLVAQSAEGTVRFSSKARLRFCWVRRVSSPAVSRLACVSVTWSLIRSRLWLRLSPCSWCLFLVLLGSRHSLQYFFSPLIGSACYCCLFVFRLQTGQFLGSQGLSMSELLFFIEGSSVQADSRVFFGLRSSSQHWGQPFTVCLLVDGLFRLEHRLWCVLWSCCCHQPILYRIWRVAA